MASFKKLSTGWQYRVSYKKADGTYGTKSGNGFERKKEAEAAAAEVERLLNMGKKMDNEVVFVDYMKMWFKRYKEGKYSVKNDNGIKTAIRIVERYFKKMKLKDIDRGVYQDFINWYAKDHATSTVRKLHSRTSECLKEALDSGLIYSDPTRKTVIKGEKASQKEAEKYLNKAQTSKLIDALKNGIRPNYRSRYMCLLGLATGARFSEIAALTWDDIDLKNKTVSINKSYDHVASRKIVSTKTESSKRVITIDDETVLLLKEYKMGNSFTAYLFKNHVSNKAANKALKRACKRAGVPEITFHSLRHIHSTLLLYNGADIQYVSQRLGHSSVTITYNVYAHVINEMTQRENKKADQLMADLYNAK